MVLNLIFWSGLLSALPKKRRLVRAVRDHAFFAETGLHLGR